MDSHAFIPFDDYLAQIETAREYLVSRLNSFVPKILVICGSGLGGLADELDHPISVSYHDIPNFPTPTVAGHAGRLVFGHCHGKPIVCMVGRLHAYEGYNSQKLTFPVRVMKALGVEILLVTNASGGLNKAFRAGDVMIIKDHISLPGLSGQSPLMGPNDERLGPRFTPMTDPYDRELLKLAKRTAVESKHDFVRVGVYAHVAGPAYETRSEAKFLVLMGGDAVGMSTVPEVVVARHASMRVLGLSLITNLVAKEEEDDFITNHEEVLSTSKERSKVFKEYVHQIIARME